MNSIVKGIIITAVAMYVILPDICPGPVDDFIAILFAVAATKYKTVD